jgi:PAS domain S-box-containing protein/putative nucleotidyltransferase with HDIG domain
MKQKPMRKESRAKSKRISKERYRLSFYDNPQPMWMFDPGTLKFLDVNQAALDKYGFTREEFLGMTIADIRPQEDLDKLLETVKTRDGLQTTGEWRHILKDGRIIDVEISSQIMEWKGRKTIMVVAQDITRRKSTERELRGSLERYHNTLDHMLEGYQIIDFDWRYIYLNEAAARQAQHAPDELLMHTMMEVYPGIENTAMFSMLKRCMANRVPQHMENEFKYPNGNSGWFELSIQPIPEGLLILSIDITDRKLAETKIRSQLEFVTALRQIDIAVLSSVDLKTTLKISLRLVSEQLGVDAANVLLLEPTSNQLKFSCGYGFRSAAIEHSRLRVGEGLAGRVLLERRTIRVPALKSSHEFLRRELLEGEGFESYIGLPLIAKGRARGVLEIFQRSPLRPELEWLNSLEVMANQAAIAVDNAALFTDAQRSNSELTLAYESTLEGWSAALDLRDKETEGHTQRVTALTLELARAMGVFDSELAHMRRGALLHDIGKMGVPDHILLKPGTLSDEDWSQMRKHPVFAFDMLSHIAYLRPALDIPYCHHERWDGSGYPRGLKRDEIPFSARIFAVVDVYDALTSDRPYRKGWSKRETLEYIRLQSGSHFDPKVVEAFLIIIDRK